MELSELERSAIHEMRKYKTAKKRRGVVKKLARYKLENIWGGNVMATVLTSGLKIGKVAGKGMKRYGEHLEKQQHYKAKAKKRAETGWTF